jgi:hypothetical protein
MGAVTDFFLGGSLAPLGVTVSFVSAAATDELDRLLNWRKSRTAARNHENGAPSSP